MQVSLKYAQENLPDLLTAVDTGEEVELTRPGQPSVRLLLVEPLSKPKSATGKRILGAGRGELRFPTFEEWQAIDSPIWTTPERPRAELFGSLQGKIELGDDWDSPETNDEIADLFENSEGAGYHGLVDLGRLRRRSGAVPRRSWVRPAETERGAPFLPQRAS